MCFEELVKRISPTLKKITYKLNGHYSFFNDEDLYQEALLYLWRDFREGKLDDKTDSYILQGCYFHLKNYLRKLKEKVKLVSLNALVSQEKQAEIDLEKTLCLKNPESYFEDLECKILVEEMQKNGLTQREREVLNLCLTGLTTREIGQHLGISHVRVIKLKNRVKTKCRKYIEW